MSTQKKPVLPPPLAEVRKQTDSAIAASVESTEQIEESRRLSKDSGKHIAATLPAISDRARSKLLGSASWTAACPGELSSRFSPIEV